jgi:hypothetical protein
MVQKDGSVSQKLSQEYNNLFTPEKLMWTSKFLYPDFFSEDITAVPIEINGIIEGNYRSFSAGCLTLFTLIPRTFYGVEKITLLYKIKNSLNPINTFSERTTFNRKFKSSGSFVIPISLLVSGIPNTPKNYTFSAHFDLKKFRSDDQQIEEFLHATVQALIQDKEGVLAKAFRERLKATETNSIADIQKPKKSPANQTKKGVLPQVSRERLKATETNSIADIQKPKKSPANQTKKGVLPQAYQSLKEVINLENGKIITPYYAPEVLVSINDKVQQANTIALIKNGKLINYDTSYLVGTELTFAGKKLSLVFFIEKERRGIWKSIEGNYYQVGWAERNGIYEYFLDRVEIDKDKKKITKFMGSYMLGNDNKLIQIEVVQTELGDVMIDKDFVRGQNRISYYLPNDKGIFSDKKITLSHFSGSKGIWKDDKNQYYILDVRVNVEIKGNLEFKFKEYK